MIIEDGIFLSKKFLKQILLLSKIEIINSSFVFSIIFQTGNGTSKQTLFYNKKVKAIEERDLLMAVIDGKLPPQKPKAGFPLPSGGSSSIN